MKINKLITLLKTFSPADWKQFRLFLQSPFYNQREILVKILDYLQTCSPKFKSDLVSFPKIAAELSLPTDNLDKFLNPLMHYLLKLGEQFIGIQEYQKKDETMNFDILEGLLNRKLDKHYQFNISKLQKNLQQSAQQDSSYFQNQFRLAELGDKHFQSLDERRFDPHLQEMGNQLDLWYFSKKMRLLCEMKNRGKIFKEGYQLNFAEEMIHCIEESSFLDKKYIKCYYHVFMIQQSVDKEKHFEALKDIFLKDHSSFPLSDQKDILSHILNYCIQQIRLQSDKTAFTENALNFYMFGIDQKILLDNKRLSPWHYKNIIKLGINLKKYDWVENFALNYNKLLDKKEQENALCLNLADLYFHQEKYDLAMDYLNQARFTDIHHQLNAKVLLAQIFYEQNEEEPLISLLASFSVYLQRNRKISSTLRLTYSNFCKILNAILRNNPKKYPKIAEQIKTLFPLTGREWLKKVFRKETNYF